MGHLNNSHLLSEGEEAAVTHIDQDIEMLGCLLWFGQCSHLYLPSDTLVKQSFCYLD